MKLVKYFLVALMLCTFLKAQCASAVKWDAKLHAPKDHNLAKHMKVPTDRKRDFSYDEEEMLHDYLFHNEDGVFDEDMFDEDILEELSMDMFDVPLEKLKGEKDIHKRHGNNIENAAAHRSKDHAPRRKGKSISSDTVRPKPQKDHNLAKHMKVPTDRKRDFSYDEEEMLHDYIFHNDDGIFDEGMFDEDILEELSMDMFDVPLEKLKGGKGIHKHGGTGSNKVHEDPHISKANTPRHKGNTLPSASAHTHTQKDHNLAKHMKVPTDRKRDFSYDEEEMLHDYLFHNDDGIFDDDMFDDDILEELSMDMFDVPLEKLKGEIDIHKRNDIDNNKENEVAYPTEAPVHKHKGKTEANGQRADKVAKQKHVGLEPPPHEQRHKDTASEDAVRPDTTKSNDVVIPGEPISPLDTSKHGYSYLVLGALVVGITLWLMCYGNRKKQRGDLPFVMPKNYQSLPIPPVKPCVRRKNVKQPFDGDTIITFNY